MWAKLLGWHSRSQTVIFARVQQIVGVTGAVTLVLLHMVDGFDPSWIAPWLPPKVVPMLPMIFFLLGKTTEILRRRPGSDDPVT